MEEYMKLKILQNEYHRNGVSGTGFNVMIFKTKGDRETANKVMMGVIFPDKGSVAVFDLNKLAQQNIKFGDNSWRGDYFEAGLRKHLKLQQALRTLEISNK